RTDVAFELRLLHQLRGLLARTAEKQRASRGVQRVREIANSAQACGVNRGHVAQTKDNNGRQLVEGMQNVRELIGCAKKEWPMNTVNNRVVRNVLSLKDMDTAVFYIVLGYRAYCGGPRNFANERERGQHHSDFHGKRQVGDDG